MMMMMIMLKLFAVHSHLGEKNNNPGLGTRQEGSGITTQSSRSCSPQCTNDGGGGGNEDDRLDADTNMAH